MKNKICDKAIWHSNANLIVSKKTVFCVNGIQSMRMTDICIYVRSIAKTQIFLLEFYGMAMNGLLKNKQL